MKKIILGMLVLGAITSTSCKKDKDDNPSCEKTVAGIANTFKLTGLYTTINGAGGDAYGSLSSCTKNATYQLKSDKTAVYSESGSGCSTTGDTGDWDVVGDKLTINVFGIGAVDNATINSWDCTTLVVTEETSGSGITTSQKYTFTKQ
jgi:hypothetical protein